MDVLVLGGGYAGVTAAVRIARAGVRTTLIDANGSFSERVRFHEVATGRERTRLAFDALVAGTGAMFEQARVESVDVEARAVTLHTPDGVSVTRRYDRLVFALGSVPSVDAVPGVREHGVSLSDHATARAAAARLQSSATIAVVGGGLTGIELATEIAEQRTNARVVWFTAGDVAAGLSRAGADHVRETARALGIDLREHTRVTAVHANAVELAGGARVPCDVCVWAGAMVPTPIARATGLRVNDIGQIVVDRYLRTPSNPEVFVVGDAATFVDGANAPLRMACATAMPMAHAAAANVVASVRGEKLRPFRYAFILQCISLGRTRGIVQPVRRDDSPLGWVITGRVAAWIKEAIVRYTVWGLTARSYSYPHTGLPARAVPRLAAKTMP